MAGDIEGMSAQLQALISRAFQDSDGIHRWFTGAADEQVNNGFTDLLTLAGLIAWVQARTDATLEPNLPGGIHVSQATLDDVPITSSAVIEAVVQTLVNRDAYILALRGAVNGLAPLDAGQRVPLINLPQSIQGGLNYQGVWDATAGAAPSATPAKGQFWIVSTSGGFSLSGITDWKATDWAVYDGAAWGKVDNTDGIVSVFGRSTNAIVAALGDYAASLITYSNATSGLSATQVQAAIDEILTRSSNQRLNADSAVTGSTPAATNLAFNIGANETWTAEFDLVASGSGIGGCRPSITVPSGATLEVTALGNAGTSTTFMSGETTVSGTNLGSFVPTQGRGILRLSVSVKAGATAGAVTLQHQSSSGQTSTIHAGSVMRARKASSV